MTIEALPNEKGFVSLGTGRLIHDSSGYRLVPDNTDQAAVKNSPDSFPIIIKPHTLESVQTEYNYRGRGKCIVISTRSCCYYCYGKSHELIVTKQEFAQEYFYKEARKK